MNASVTSLRVLFPRPLRHPPLQLYQGILTCHSSHSGSLTLATSTTLVHPAPARFHSCQAASQYPRFPWPEPYLPPTSPASHLGSRRSLQFDAVTRDLREIDPAIRIGQFMDCSGMVSSVVNLGTNKRVTFKSKVVSRAHVKIWV